MPTVPLLINGEWVESSALSFAKLFVGLPPSMLAKRSPDLQKSVELTGKLAASRSEPCQILVSVPPSDRPAVVGWLNSGMAQGGKAGQPAPDVRVVSTKPGDFPFPRVQPQNQQQFANASRSAMGVTKGKVLQCPCILPVR